MAEETPFGKDHAAREMMIASQVVLKCKEHFITTHKSVFIAATKDDRLRR